MLRINKKMEYALMCLKHMLEKATSEELTTAREICDKLGAPFDTTSKVLQAMNHAHILKSVKGIKGGYFLANDLSQISFIELARCVENKEFEGPCLSEKGTCDHFNLCNIKTPVAAINHKVFNFLNQVSIRELLMGDISKVNNSYKGKEVSL